ncbi:MAG: LLM class flavin-dependent oxidoreductase [Alphaproteobacteria bacterium]|jgi:alkanesulfonate monooxygenase SsuD/methylene tetrahydromethanopterin reductase-like flavin-dependent oxidoreductase (luciferase family)|nr:LLM class flavin-dependent oxidoreductase [Alphaproteobacteria bacterium]
MTDLKTWFFTEDCYPDLPEQNSYDSIRVDLPNKYCDPENASRLYNQYLDIWCAADEMGLEIMLNEHHQTATCMVPAAPIMLGILARQTKDARLLILGNPLPNRNQPVRVAEEMALVDVISKGRVEVGFVRSVPYEAAAANILPYRGSERLWESHDLILKAWTTHDGPFNFEGEWYHHRQVNIWPRPYQQPHPPVWITTGSAASTLPVAQHKHVGAIFLAGYSRVRPIFDAYRENYLKLHGEHAPLDRLAYCGLIYVGDDEKTAAEGANKMMWYMQANKVADHWKNPPGYHPPVVSANVLRGAHVSGSGAAYSTDLAEHMRRGNVFAGTPDQVYEQIKAFWEYSGGFGHMLMMGQAGHMTEQETLRSMHLYNSEVYPRLKELAKTWDPEAIMDKRADLPDRDHAEITDLAVDFVR